MDNNLETLTLDKILKEIQRTERLNESLAPQHQAEGNAYIQDLKREKSRRETAERP